MQGVSRSTWLRSLLFVCITLPAPRAQSAMQDIVASLVLLAQASNCDPKEFLQLPTQMSAHQDMHSLRTPSINDSQSTRPAFDLMLRKPLTPAYSKSLGPSPAFWRPQPGRPRSLCRLFHPLPHPQPEAAEVCHPVRSRLSISYTPSTPSGSRFLDLARTPPLARLALPRFPSLLVSPRLSSMRSSHVGAARRWCAYSRIHSIIDVLAMPGRPSSPRGDPAPDAKGSGMARLTTSSRLVPGRPAAAVHRDPRAINQNSSSLAFSRFCTCGATVLVPLSLLPIYGHDLSQYPALYWRSSMHDLLPGACGANSLVRWSMASALFLGSWAALMGPMIYGKSAPNHLRTVRLARCIHHCSDSFLRPLPPIVWLSSLLHPTRQNSTSIVLTADPTAKHLLSQERLPFTATYFGSIGLTLYFAVGVRLSTRILPLLASSRHHQRQSHHCRRIFNHQSCNTPSRMLRHHKLGTPRNLVKNSTLPI
jgi:hypothetical protein